jgi:hypothetical protein
MDIKEINMSKLHKLFDELKELSQDDRMLLQEALRDNDNVRQMCKNLGVKFSNKMLLKYIVGNQTNQGCIATPSNPVNNSKKIEKIIMGDNLDIIEEAAKKKGLI